MAETPIPQEEVDFLVALMCCPKCGNPFDFDIKFLGTCPKCGYKEDGAE